MPEWHDPGQRHIRYICGEPAKEQGGARPFFPLLNSLSLSTSLLQLRQAYTGHWSEERAWSLVPGSHGGAPELTPKAAGPGHPACGVTAPPFGWLLSCGKPKAPRRAGAALRLRRCWPRALLALPTLGGQPGEASPGAHTHIQHWGRPAHVQSHNGVIKRDGKVSPSLYFLTFVCQTGTACPSTSRGTWARCPGPVFEDIRECASCGRRGGGGFDFWFGFF